MYRNFVTTRTCVSIGVVLLIIGIGIVYSIAKAWIFTDDGEYWQHTNLHDAEAAVRVHPDNANDRGVLAFHYWNAHRYSDAIAQFHQIERIDPTYRDAPFWTATIYDEMGDATKARAEWLVALKRAEAGTWQEQQAKEHLAASSELHGPN